MVKLHRQIVTSLILLFSINVIFAEAAGRSTINSISKNSIEKLKVMHSDAPASPKYMGLYKIEPNYYLFIGGDNTSGDNLSLNDTKTGEVRSLVFNGSHTFTYGPSRSTTTPTAGTIRFILDRDIVTGFVWEPINSAKYQASKVPLNIEEVSFKNRDDAQLSGELITPVKRGSYPVVVLIPFGDRYSMWEVAMWLVKNDIGVFLYDRRNTGKSTGEKIALNDNLSSYTYNTMIHADDTVAAVKFVRTLPGVKAEKVGVLGWSEGGWIGSMVALRVKDLAFYVNVAANANPWAEQAKHRFLSRMKRERFSGKDLKEADEYFNAYAKVGSGEISWEDYVDVRNMYRESKWFKFLLENFALFNHNDLQKAIRHYLVEYSPASFNLWKS